MRALLLALALGSVLLGPSSAWADRREAYVLLEASPGIAWVSDAADGQSQTSSFEWGGGLVAYYGLTNALHLGVAMRGLMFRDTAFEGKAVLLPDGLQPTGALYQNALGISATALVSYRMDTGYALAPVARLELGVQTARYSALEFRPERTSLSVPLPDKSELSPAGRLVLALEYRLGSRFVASVGVSGHLGAQALLFRQLTFPVNVGVVW